MKITKVILALLVCLAFIFGGCVTIVYQQREPVTLEIINDIKKNITGADFYLSTSIEIFSPSLQEDRKIIQGDYTRASNTSTNRIKILHNSPGKYDSITPNGERINIIFGNIILSFVKISNERVYRYELDSANMKDENLQIYFPKDRPYLVIHTKEEQNQRIIPAQAIPGSQVGDGAIQVTPQAANQGAKQSITSDVIKEEQNQKIIPTQAILGSQVGDGAIQVTPQVANQGAKQRINPDAINVLGSGKLNRSDTNAIVDYVIKRNPSIIPYSIKEFDLSSVAQIIYFYFIEAEREGINPDLAIVQMLWSMQYFSNSSKYKGLRQAHNYGGLNISKNIRNEYWDGKSFTGRNTSESRRIGIQAHIQFLKRSASGNLNSLQTPVVLPTWNALADVAGTRKTLEDISPSWGGSKYVNNVSEIYNELISYVKR